MISLAARGPSSSSSNPRDRSDGVMECCDAAGLHGTRVTPYPMGRIVCFGLPGTKVPGHVHLVPTGQAPPTQSRPFTFHFSPVAPIVFHRPKRCIRTMPLTSHQSPVRRAPGLSLPKANACSGQACHLSTSQCAPKTTPGHPLVGPRTELEYTVPRLPAVLGP
jgi:hypothetical protein